MSDRSFLDTNILVYTDDSDTPAKKAKALDLFAECRRAGTGVVSTQVLQEYFVAAVRKLGVDAARARRKTALFGRLQLVSIGLDDILASIDLHRLHPLSFWDALTSGLRWRRGAPGCIRRTFSTAGNWTDSRW